MRIAISVEKKNDLDSTVAHHFGRCPFFALVDVKGTEIQAIEVIENPFFSAHEPGEVPGFIKEQKADVMLSGGMGGRAIQFFKELDIKASTGATGTVRSALENYFGGELSEAAPCAESVEHGHGEAH
ncbi:MAG: NifB/NifX family molybdenum-iron cluster-binding protein [Anaerolineae bacterium]|jgi:predicted Fe-Mo cluster-binding NifX family protein|nr:NifB/NifX family molybdenum-iron cluster-binding protein [Anaerolineae bacterium]MBT3714428.1 NifB/NifX family molybdenum-iron cluster-binding protein [Anaerolineae bacterium]MBT4309252.1 NifB/NifX family molybdenum-iron cluster-binding protein [Anaerolineae bacterium]MBT4458517.1 NifB/NifX family molybdenum-iron cluster-binding protein [Anaerolineae bacterium]MBT4842694.1 NifB/NifX family molybdenum-iron cluster-binding protein [Anaerolineae bacterium]